MWHKNSRKQWGQNLFLSFFKLTLNIPSQNHNSKVSKPIPRVIGKKWVMQNSCTYTVRISIYVNILLFSSRTSILKVFLFRFLKNLSNTHIFDSRSTFYHNTVWVLPLGT